MTKKKHQPATTSEAVRAAIAQEEQARPNDLKPIEIVKVALCAYQAYENKAATIQSAPTNASHASARAHNPTLVESKDREGFQRGRQDALDRVLFNINYWRSAYEDKIVTACKNANDAILLLDSISTWKNTPCRLNTRSFEDTQKNLFERFCPPLSENNRRGKKQTSAAKGPVPHFLAEVQHLIERDGEQACKALINIAAEVKQEAAVYRSFTGEALDAFYDLLPAWCLQNNIELANGSWWEDADVMLVITSALQQCFIKMDYPVSTCTYFADSMREAIDGYQRDVSSSLEAWHDQSIAELLAIIKGARAHCSEEQHDFEIDGYGDSLPAWLHFKEQLIWNTIVCACYGPLQARPFVPENNAITKGSSEQLDAITSMAQAAYESYVLSARQDEANAKRETRTTTEKSRFEDQPDDLKTSMLAQIESIHDKLAILGYHIVPASSCYPEQRIDGLTVSEVDCLAVLEHRRWLAERKQAGWTYAPKKDVAAKETPYLVAWEDLPEREREYNRKSVRIIPSLLASVGLAISC